MFYESNRGGRRRARKIGCAIVTHCSCAIRGKLQYPTMHFTMCMLQRLRVLRLFKLMVLREHWFLFMSQFFDQYETRAVYYCLIHIRAYVNVLLHMIYNACQQVMLILLRLCLLLVHQHWQIIKKIWGFSVKFSKYNSYLD